MRLLARREIAGSANRRYMEEGLSQHNNAPGGGGEMTRRER